jgi:hypothetical protein
MERVGAALGDRVYHAARGAAELSGISGRLDLDLFDEVGQEILSGDAALKVGCLGSVDDVAVLAGTCTVNREPAQFGFLIGRAPESPAS